MSTPTDTDNLPPFVILGQWKDEEWQSLSRRLTSALTGAELARVISGPRHHPYDPREAFSIIKGSEVYVFPSVKAAENE